MTYQEIKDRLSKCELTLEKFKNGVNIDNKEAQAKINKLTILKESLTKKLAEAQSKTYLVTPKKGQTTAVAMSDDETDALKDADDVKAIKGIDGEEIKEQEGIKFSVEETKSIAKKVGKAVAISLKSLGDSVKSMKAKNIEENSFDIQVNYKGEGPEDSFSFYITDDTLHLTDFSFDKEITDVGVKPSGEALVNVDVVANELQKHFKSMNEGEVSEAPEGMYYIKIPKDAASQNKAQVIFNDLHGINYELNDDPDGIFMYFKKEDFDAGVIDDLEGDGVHILDTNIPNVNEDAEEDAKNDADYEAGWHDDPRQDEDKDIGHQDDEPNMLGASALETAEYAAKLYKKLQRYDNFDGEVDFPHWWQKKLVLARDYMSAAFHYLDSEEKQPAIDKLALENLTFKEPKGIDKVAGGIPYRREGNKFIISMSLPDDVKERLLAKAKKNGFQAAPNQAGGITVIAKDNVNEVDEDRFVRAAFEDLEQVIRNLAHTANISEDEALEMAIRKLEAMLDGRDDMEEDNNPVPQGKHIKVDDMQFMHDQIVSRMKMLAKIYKEKGPEATVMLGPNNDREVKVVDTLKILTQKKRELEDALQNKVAGIGKDQELDEAGPGFKHDCAAKVVHEKYGKGNTIPEKHTLVKEGNKYVVTHYDVLFENGNTVLDIPVNELKIETTNEHWHKGYKKKKK